MFRKLVAILLSLTTLIMAVPVSAATGEYVSEIRMSCSEDSAESAKAWLNDNGYQIIDKDLNGGTGEGWAYLGYKTTMNPNEAITDMKIMNMKGGFSVSDTSEEIKKMQGDMTKDAEAILAVVDKVRMNYNEGSPYASLAVDGLNCYIFDESGALLGDKLLEGISNDEMIKLLFFTEAMFVTPMLQMLAVGLRGRDDIGWINKAVINISNQEESYEEYIKDEAYDYLYPVIINFASQYKEINDKLLDEGEEALDDSEIAFIAKAEAVFGIPLEEGTILDYLLKEDIRAEDLFPISAALSEEQIILTDTIGLMNSSFASVISEEEIPGMSKEMGAIEKAHIWESIDENNIDKPVAVTVNAGREMQLDKSILESKSGIIGAVAVGVSVAGVVTGALLIKAGAKAFTKSEALISGIAERIWLENLSSAGINKTKALSASLSENAGLLKTAGVMLIVGFVLIAAVAALVTISEYYNPQYTDIPFYMVDASQNPKTGENIYVKYQAVLDKDGKPGDLNTWAGKSWNAVYTTKDSNAGKPIYANFLYQENDAYTPDNAYPVSNFGQNVAANLNQDMFNTDISHYLFISRNESFISSLASSFGGVGGITMLLGSGLILGALGGTLITLKVQKKRRNEAG